MGQGGQALRLCRHLLRQVLPKQRLHGAAAPVVGAGTALGRSHYLG